MLEILKQFGISLTLEFDKKKTDLAKKEVGELGKQMRDIALHVAEASAAIFEFANLAGENSRSLEENSDMLGINVERLQELSYAAKVAANVSRGELVGALESVSTTLDKARHSDVMAAESLVRLGIPLEMITDKTTTADQVMLSLADSFKNIHDPIAKARLATEVFGSAGAKLLPLLNKGSAGMAAMGKEARDLGVVLKKDVIEQGAEFDRQFSKIWIVIKNITYLIGNELIKYLKPMVTEFQKFIVANKQLIASGIVGVMKSLGEYLQIVFKVVKFVADRFAYLTHILGGMEKVTKAIATGLAIITGIKVVSGLGTLLTSFRAIGLVLEGISITTTLIGAGLLALILVVQDVFSDDSIIKEWFKTLEEGYPTIKKLADVLAWMAGTQTKFTAEAPKSKGFFSGIADGFAGLKGASLSSLNPFAAPQSSVAKGSAGAVAAAGAGGMQENNIEVHQSISVPPGTSAGSASKIVGDGLHEALGGVLRQTRNQAIGGVAY